MAIARRRKKASRRGVQAASSHDTPGEGQAHGCAGQDRTQEGRSFHLSACARIKPQR